MEPHFRSLSLSFSAPTHTHTQRRWSHSGPRHQAAFWAHGPNKQIKVKKFNSGWLRFFFLSKNFASGQIWPWVGWFGGHDFPPTTCTYEQGRTHAVAVISLSHHAGTVEPAKVGIRTSGNPSTKRNQFLGNGENDFCSDE